MTLLDVVTFIGSIVGLITGIYTLFKELSKSRPIASLSYISKGDGHSPRIRIRNVCDHDIAIMNIEVQPQIYIISDGDEPEDLLRAAFGESPYFVLKPGEEKSLRIGYRMKDGVNMDLIPQPVKFKIIWRRCDSTWMPRIPVKVKTRTEIIQKFSNAKPDIAI